MSTINDGVLIHPTGSGGIGSDGGMNVRWQPAPDLLKIFRDPRTRPVKIRSVFKYDENIGIPKHGLGAHRLNVRCCQQSGDDWVSDLVLDHIGRLPRPFGVDDDLHIADIGKRIQRDVTQAPNTRYRQQHDPGKNQETILFTPLNNSGDHYMPPVALTLSCLLAIV